MIKRLLPSLISAVIAIAAIIILFSPAAPPAPNLVLTDIDGKQHAIYSEPNTPLLVVFWATDCPGCIKEIPDLLSLHQKFSPQGLRIISVALAHDTPAQLNAMRTAKQIPYPIVWDESGEIATAFNDVRVTPTNFLINSSGEIVMRKIGELKLDQLTEKLYNIGLNAQ